MNIVNKSLKEKRNTFRIPTTNFGCTIFDLSKTNKGTGYWIKEMSPKGMFVERLVNVAIGSELKVLFKVHPALKIGGLLLDAKVAYTSWDNHKNKNKTLGSGLTFINVTEDEAKLLKEHCIILREELIKEALKYLQSYEANTIKSLT